MINWRDIVNLQIFKTLTLKKNAVLQIEAQNGTVSVVDLTELASLNGLTATAAEINAVADVSANYEVVTAANIITAAETGKKFILNSATGFQSTLPTAALGLEFWFYIGGTEPTTSHTIVTAGAVGEIQGNIVSAGGAAVTVVSDADTITFTGSAAVNGDMVHLWADATAWYLTGMSRVQTGITTSASP